MIWYWYLHILWLVEWLSWRTWLQVTSVSSQWVSRIYISVHRCVNVSCWWSCLRGTGCRSWWRSWPHQDSRSSTRTRWRKSRRSASVSLTVVHWLYHGVQAGVQGLSLNCCVSVIPPRVSNDCIEHVYHSVMSQLNQEHAEIRLSAFQITSELFSRSHHFRTLLVDNFQVLAAPQSAPHCT